MIKFSTRKILAAITLRGQVRSLSSPGLERAQVPLTSAAAGDDPAPYAAKDLKLFWSRWDEYHRRKPGLSYKTLYSVAVAMILAGWLISLMHRPSSPVWGSVLMVGGSLFGVGCCLKALRQKRRLARRR
jgi:hypothetical protein